MNTKRTRIVMASIVGLAAFQAGLVLAADQAQAKITTPENGNYATRTDLPGSRGMQNSGIASEVDFARLDVNHNLTISRNEAENSKALSSQFDRVDQNHDFQITPSEFSAFEVEQMQAQQKGHGTPGKPPANTQHHADSNAGSSAAASAKQESPGGSAKTN